MPLKEKVLQIIDAYRQRINPGPVKQPFWQSRHNGHGRRGRERADKLKILLLPIDDENVFKNTIIGILTSDDMGSSNTLKSQIRNCLLHELNITKKDIDARVKILRDCYDDAESDAETSRIMTYSLSSSDHAFGEYVAGEVSAIIMSPSDSTLRTKAEEQLLKEQITMPVRRFYI